MKHVSSSRKSYLILILGAYVIFASIFGLAYRYQINPDGVSLIRLAEYIADGHFQRSVSLSWSPLFTWIIAPFIFAGFDGLDAARIATALCGAGMVLSCWHLSSRFGLSASTRFTAVMAATILISFWTVQFITSDVLSSALMLWYLYIVTDPTILKRRKLAYWCGIVTGFSYLAHHYALPFFIVHFIAVLLLRGYLDFGNRFPVKQVLASWVTGIVGFAIITSMWIAVSSIKYGRFSISSKGGIAHAAVGPKDVDRRHPFFVGGLYKPKDAYAIHVFEDPTEVEFKTWSPFENREHFLHQLDLIKNNAIHIINHFVNQSPFFTYPFIIGILTLIPVAILLTRMDNANKFLYAWVVVTFIIYNSGFLLIIARSPRRFYALMAVFLLVSFHFAEKLLNGVNNLMSERKRRILTIFLVFILLSAFVIKPGINLIKSIKTVTVSKQVNPYQEIAMQVGTFDFPEPFAVIRSSQKAHTDYYIAYFLRKQLLGRPHSDDPEGIASEMKSAEARSLLVFDNKHIAELLMHDKRFIYVGGTLLKESSRYSSAVNIKQDEITDWDREVNVFITN